MKSEILPIGTVVKTKKNKLGIITGYYSMGGNYYNLVPFPFDCMNVDCDLKGIKEFQWFEFALTYVKESEIEEIIFLGYKDESFEELKKQ